MRQPSPFSLMGLMGENGGFSIRTFLIDSKHTPNPLSERGLWGAGAGGWDLEPFRGRGLAGDWAALG